MFIFFCFFTFLVNILEKKKDFLPEELLAVLAGGGNGPGDGAEQLDDVRQVVLVTAVILT